MPSFWVLKNQEKETGVTVFFMNEGIDTGPILHQKKVKILNVKHWDLIKMTKFLGMEAVIESIKKIDSGKYKLRSNNDNKATYYSFPTKADVKVFRQQGGRFF